MKTSRLWLISGSAALVAVIIGVTAAVIRPEPAPEASAPSPAPAATATATATATPAPTTTAQTAEPTSEPPAAPAVTCDQIVTADFLASMGSRGWAARDTLTLGGGARPFDFPDGVLLGAAVCRWQPNPDASTGDGIELGWAPLPPEAQADVIQTLGARGYTLSPEADGVFVELAGEGVYLLTSDDVRWAPSRADLASISAPADIG